MTDADEPLINSPMTLESVPGDPSPMRTTLTSTPLASSPRANAELNWAMPHSVGGCVVRIPIVEGRETYCGATGISNDGWTDKKLKVIPTGGCHRRAGRERMLGKSGAERLTHPGLAGFPTPSTVHPSAVST